MLHYLLAAVNHVLAKEPSACDLLAAHSGKIVQLNLEVVQVSCQIAGDGLLELTTDGIAGVTLHVKWVDIPMLYAQRDRLFSFVRIEGDADCAHAIAQAAAIVRWDVEDDLSRCIGDVSALRLISGAKNMAEYLKLTQKKLLENAVEYLLEEQPVLVRPQEMTDFGVSVIKMRDDVERVEKRMKKLYITLANK